MPEDRSVFIVSDSLGETASNVVEAAASQFDASNINIVKFSHVKTRRELKNIALQAADSDAMIVYTLINPELRKEFYTFGRERDISMIDIMGPVMEKMEEMLNTSPVLQPGLRHQLDQNYFKRVEAMEFTVKYDDRNDKKGIELADVVLIGVSRTSKTPLCIYLSYRGFKAANIPLVPEVDIPELLYENPENKVIGLTIDPLLLNEIRQERLKALGLSPDSQYASIKRINEELDYADDVMKRIGCPVLNVTNKSIEESANEVQDYLN
ncbi:MAG: pyruvate, water dikinase regulatory protein [Bacillota bacterium]